MKLVNIIFLKPLDKVFGGGFLIGYTIKKIEHYKKQDSEEKTQDGKCGIRKTVKNERKKKKKESDLLRAPYSLNPHDYNVNEGDPISSFELPMRKSKKAYQKRNNSVDISQEEKRMEKVREEKLKKTIRAHYDYDSMFVDQLV